MNTRSEVLQYELGEHIAQGCLTNSKHPDRFVKDVYPQVVSHGRSCYLWDIQGRKYVDFICGLGTNLYGYGNENIKREMVRNSGWGSCHSFPSKWEIKTAKKVKECMPWVQRVKFVNDGSSACTAACLIARAYHQSRGNVEKLQIVSDGYHGWHPEFTYLTKPRNGVIGGFSISSGETLDQAHDSLEFIAAMIIEPVVVDDSKAHIEALKDKVEFCRDNDILVIFDETITALRYPKLSVARYYNIIPDLFIFGKALGNGEKISCVCGPEKIMDCDYFVSGTYHGHAPSLIASHMVLHMAKTDSRFDVQVLKDRGIEFMEKFNELTVEHGIRLHGYGTRGVFKGDELAKAIWMQEMCKAGYLFGPSFFLNWDLLEHLDGVLYFTERIMEKIKNGTVKLEGKMPTSPFSSKARNL
jgi:glutamate-1-semialdehyde aminotransferase